MLVAPALFEATARKALAQTVTVSPEDASCVTTNVGNIECSATETVGPAIQINIDNINLEFDASGRPADTNSFGIGVQGGGAINFDGALSGGSRGIDFTLGPNASVVIRNSTYDENISVVSAAVGLVVGASADATDINATIMGTLIEERVEEGAVYIDAHTDGLHLYNQSPGSISALITGSVTSRGNAIVALSRGNITIENRGDLTNTGEQPRDERGVGSVENAGLLVWATGDILDYLPGTALTAQNVTINSSGTIVGDNVGIRIVHSGNAGLINVTVAGLVEGGGGVAILPTYLFEPLESVRRVNADFAVTLQPGWETVGETYGFTDATARLIFGGTAEQTAQNGSGQFDLADWSDLTLNEVSNDSSLAPDQTTNGFYFFDPVLLKTGTSTFVITDDGSVSENDSDGLPGPAFTEAIVDAGILVLNDATITMALQNPSGPVQDGPVQDGPGGGFVIVDPGVNDSRETFEVRPGTTLGAMGESQITGNLNNSGTLDLSTFDRTAGTRLTITDDYTANSNLVLDVVLGGDGSPSDVLVIGGDTSPSTTHVTVINAGGNGALTTGNGILVIDADPSNTLDGTFELSQPVFAGAYEYDLFDGPLSTSDPVDGNWYLRTIGFQPGAPVYEALPSTLLNASRVGTLAQRIEGRQILTQAVDADTPTGAWLRVEGSRMELTPARSTTSTSYDQNMWRLQGGVDVLAHEGELGNLVVGANVFTGSSSADIASSSGNGSISTDTQGVGLTATWYGDSGFYADAQLQYSDFESDLSSSVLGTLATDINGSGRLASIEIGQEVTLPSGLSLTPQAQLTWSDVSFDSFTGPSGEIVSPASNDSLQLRLGLAAERSWDLGSGESARLYGIGNVVRELRDTSSVLVSGTELALSAPRWVGEIGLGGSYDVTQDTGATSSFYGEVSASRELSGGTVRGLAGTIGFRMEF
jgi:outer membrane autotransporter protein